jgi:hypothetical protein
LGLPLAVAIGKKVTRKNCNFQPHKEPNNTKIEPLRSCWVLVRIMKLNSGEVISLLEALP